MHWENLSLLASCHKTGHTGIDTTVNTLDIRMVTVNTLDVFIKCKVKNSV